jgi:hypothetical protein
MRADAFDSAEGPELVANLCEVISDAGGAFLDAAVELRVKVAPKGSADSAAEILPMDLYAFGRVLSASATRLCNDDPPPK